MIGKNIYEAVAVALQNFSTWPSGAVVVEYDNGTFDAFPAAVLVELVHRSRWRITREVWRIAEERDVPLPGSFAEYGLSEIAGKVVTEIIALTPEEQP